MADHEDLSPFVLLVELQNNTELLASGPRRDLESLVARRYELVKDLLFFRFYGFRAEYLENLIKTDATTQQLWAEVQKEEETADALDEFQGQGAGRAGPDRDVVPGLGEPGPPEAEGYRYTGFGTRTT